MNKTHDKQRTIDWLRSNSKAMIEYLGEREAMCRAEFYPLSFTDEQIWARWNKDNAIGLIDYYFKYWRF